MSDSTKRIILQNVTLSYPHLDKPQEPQKEGDKPKFSAAFLITEPAMLEMIKQEATAVAVTKWGATKGPGMVSVGAKGSTIRNDVKDKYPEGTLAYISARSEEQPGMVYRHADPETITAENPKGKAAKVQQDKIKETFYPGVKVNVSVTLFAYEKKTNKGVGFALNNIQLVGEGTRLDNRKKAEEEFDADLSQTPEDLVALGLA